MAYQARSNSDNKEEEKARADANNAKNVRNAADIAIASKHPYGVAIGGAIKGADKLTGGRASKALGKGLTNLNRMSPMGKMAQGASNKFAESGISDKAGKAASIYNSAQGAGGKNPGETPNQVKNKRTAGGDQNNDTLPSSDEKKNENVPGSSNNDDGKKKSSKLGPSSDDDSVEEEQQEEKSSAGMSSVFGVFGVRKIVIMVTLTVLPFLLVLFFFIVISSTVLEIFTTYDDAFGVSSVAGEENGNMNYSTTDKSQNSFFERVNDVKLRYQAQGRSFEAYKVAAVYSALHSNNRKFTYNDMTDEVISDVADAMFEGNYYSDSIFKTNLISTVFPKYAAGSSSKYDDMADEVIKYIDDYESIVGVSHQNRVSGSYSSCASTGSCTYDIKGYYIQGKGIVPETIQVNDLYVRLMQCGIGNNHNYGGQFGKPLAGEALVPFEKYILGVAYQEIGPDAPAEAIKAQMVAARSYILARHAVMGSWRTLKKESGRWIIQVASCTQDQVYCDPDQGCSSNDGQWGQIHSGLSYDTGFSKQPMPKNSPLRTYATETSGEVLVNKNGYIIYTDYLQYEQDQFVDLADRGLNYKQILLQVYNQGSRKSGAFNILKSSCTNSGSTCSNASGSFTNWRQTDPAWANIKIGSSGKTIGQIGCNVTSIAIQIARSGVATSISDFNPGTFVEAMNGVGGFGKGGDTQYYPVSKIAPSFQFSNSVNVRGMSRNNKLNTLKNILADSNNYVIAEVAGDTGQHWVAVESVQGDAIKMIDPGSNATDMWTRYNWNNTTNFVYFRAVR